MDAVSWSKIKLLREPSGRVRYLTEEEEARLMAVLPADADRQRIKVLLQTGLRKSEFSGLRWKDIDLRAGVITIPRSKNGETRHVPMTSDVRAILSRLPRPLDASALIFPTALGLVITGGRPRPSWRPSEPLRSTISASMTFDTPLPRGWPWRRWISSQSRTWVGGRV